ncbi:hypothetical protein ACQ4PT_002052 [Festuca glaucescens]
MPATPRRRPCSCRSSVGAAGVGLKITATSEKPMSRFTEVPGGYRPVNACNGFLLLASSVHDWPVYVCNPVTGEKLEIPAPPLMNHLEGRSYALGYSPSTRQYKIFGLSFTRRWEDIYETYLDVCTLGANDGRWRRHQDLFRAVYIYIAIRYRHRCSWTESCILL